MNCRLLYCLVEGNDDERFFQNIIKPLAKNCEIITWKHAREKNKKIDNFIKSISAMGAEYVFVVDINSSPCASHKKQLLCRKLKHLKDDNIMVVKQEIESWYFAGLDTDVIKITKKNVHNCSESINKEQFDGIMSKKYDSRIDFLTEIIKSYSIKKAQNNKSFNYFCKKYI